MRLTRQILSLAAVAAMVGSAFTLHAQEAKQKNGEKKKGAAVVRGLTNPCGLAVQPGTGHVFIASKEGVTRWNPESGEKHLEIDAPGMDVYGKGPMYDIGPLGLAFASETALVVGGGGLPDGQEVVQVYNVKTEDSANHPAMTVKDATATLGPITAKEGVTAMGEGNFYGVAVGAGKVFVTCNGDDTKGWIATATVGKEGFGALTPTIATKTATNVDAPVPVTFDKEGRLVVGQMGEVNVPGDSLLCFYDAKTGKLTKSYETGLNDIAGLAYSPKTGKLYATDFSWVDAEKGALYELTIDGDKCTATQIRKLDKPTAIAFGKDGKLLVAIFGTQKEGAKQPAGRVLVIDKEL